MLLEPIRIRYVSGSVVLYEGHSDAMSVLYKLPEATIMLLRGVWGL